MNTLSVEIHPTFGQVLHPQGQDIVNVYVNGLCRTFPLEDCIKKSLQPFLDSKKSEKSVCAYILNA